MKKRLIFLLALVIPIHFASAQNFNPFPSFSKPQPSWSFGGNDSKDEKKKSEIDLTLGWSGITGNGFSSMIFTQARYTMPLGVQFMFDGGIAFDEDLKAYDVLFGAGFRALNKEKISLSTALAMGFVGQAGERVTRSNGYYTESYHEWSEGFFVGADVSLLVKIVQHVGASADLLLGLCDLEDIVFMPKLGVTAYF